MQGVDPVPAAGQHSVEDAKGVQANTPACMHGKEAEGEITVISRDLHKSVRKHHPSEVGQRIFL